MTPAQKKDKADLAKVEKVKAAMERNASLTTVKACKKFKISYPRFIKLRKKMSEESGEVTPKTDKVSSLIDAKISKLQQSIEELKKAKKALSGIL